MAEESGQPQQQAAGQPAADSKGEAPPARQYPQKHGQRRDDRGQSRHPGNPRHRFRRDRPQHPPQENRPAAPVKKEEKEDDEGEEGGRDRRSSQHRHHRGGRPPKKIVEEWEYDIYCE